MTRGASPLRRSAVAAAGLTLCGLALPAAGYQRPGALERVSVADDGGESTGWSPYSSISADGRYIAFYSDAPNLVPGDTNGQGDIFVRDRALGRTVRASVASDGTQANASSDSPSISADGRHVAFFSWATNLVAGPVPWPGQAYVHDLDTGATELVSVSSDEQPANMYSFAPSISGDGRLVTFDSLGSNLVPGDTNGQPSPIPPESDVFVRDREAGTTERVSVASDGTQANGSSRYPSISAEGRYVAFESSASNLVLGDTNGAKDPLFRTDVFVHDRVTHTTERVSVASDGTEGAGMAGFPVLTPDGRYVAFLATASNLVPNDSNRLMDVFVRDRLGGSTERVSVSSSGAEGNNSSLAPSISADGRFVGFGSDATNLVPGDSNGAHDAFLHDRLTGETARVSVGLDGRQGAGQSITPEVSADARVVSFGSYGPLLDEDHNNNFDVYALDRGPQVGVSGVKVSQVGDRLDVSGRATFDGVLAASASDPAGDSVLAEAGGDLTRVAIAYRPESEDILLLWDLTKIPGLPAAAWTQPGVAGVPGIGYRLTFSYLDSRWSVDAMRAGARGIEVKVPLMTLSRCDVTCTQVGQLEGGVGTTGPRVQAAIPLQMIGGGDGVIEEAAAATGVHTPAGKTTADVADLPDSIPLTARVSLALVREGDPAESAIFTDVAVQAGRFASWMDASGLAGPHEVLARACLATTCTLRRIPVDV